ncbi:diguanylate cyclase domain-containing protein [Paracidovorax sp. MALMAid1276]|uniref:GGDEF domain-containing protein n=1 Tax=Paracidovorax sp. MALMAid1276 TaxID=3411631 RepID=UPI003B9B1348
MPELHVATILILSSLNLVAVSLALPLVMGRNASRAARFAQGSLITQAIGWAAIVASGAFVGHWLDRALSTLCLVMASLSSYLLFRALRQWLGPRPWHRTLIVLGALMPLGYAWGFDHYSFRVGWANFLLAAMLVTVGRAALQPVQDAKRGWRWLLAGTQFVVAGFTVGRGVLGAFFPALYPEFEAPHPINVGAQVAANTALVLTTVAVLVAWRDEAEAQLRLHAHTDGLTGLHNRRSFEAQATLLLAHASRHDLPVTVMMLDLDHFKQVNDTHGHEAGDRALQLFARLLSETSRTGDVVARMGGEEFAAVLVHNRPTACRAFDRRLRAALAQAAPAELGFALDFSAGAVLRTAPPHSGAAADGDNLATLMAQADAALYRAKRTGRGRLVIDADPGEAMHLLHNA